MKRPLTHRIALLAALVLVTLASGCAVNPVTGKSELSLIPESQELAIGAEQYVPAQQSQGGQYTVDPTLTAYVKTVGQRLAKVSDRQLPYEFVVLNNDVPNAWCLPGGKIAVNRGLLTQLDNEAELAAVLGHEIVHAAAKHAVHGMQRGMLLQGLLLATAMSAKDSQYANYIVGGAQVGAQLVAQKYSREDELQADKYGTIYMSRAGYDPHAAVTLQQKFVKLAEGQNQSWLDGLFASHPPSEERVQANRATVASLPPAGELDTQRYQQALAYLESKQPAYKDFDRARTLASNKQFNDALRQVDKAIKIEPKEARFYGLRGDIYLAQDNYGKATSEFTHALGLDDNYYEYYLGRGLARAKQGRKVEARTDLQASNRLLPTAVANNELGELSLASGNKVQAKQYFAEAMNAGGKVGASASMAFAKLDIPENPGKYIEVRPAIDNNGELRAIVANRTSLDLSNISIRFTASVNGQPVQRDVRLGALGAGRQASIGSGWQFSAGDNVEAANAVVTRADVGS